MKIILLFLTIFSFNLAIAQPNIEWQKSLGGSFEDKAESILQTSDGGYIVAGYSESWNGDVTGNHGSFDFWVVKLTSTGAITWQKSLGGTSIDVAYSIQQTIDGGYIVSGKTASSNGDITGYHGYGDIWIVKLTSTGIISWQKCLGGGNEENGLSIKQTADGGYIVGGYSASADGDVIGVWSLFDLWVVKLTSTGTISWQQCLGGFNSELMFSIQQTSDGGYIVAGQSNSNDHDLTFNHGLDDFWIVKLDSIGILSWQKSLGGSNKDIAKSIQQTTDGGYIVAGHSESNDWNVVGNHGGGDMWVLKLNSLGHITWRKCLGGSGVDFAESIQQTADGGYIVTGQSWLNDGDVTTNYGGPDLWVVKLTTTGTISWQKSLGGSDYDYASSIKQTTDGGYIVAGSSRSNDGDVTGNHGDFDIWVVKLSPSVGINQTSLSSISIYPNPTTGNITINLREVKKEIQTKVINSLGKVILTQQFESTSIANLEINAPTGFYYLQIEIPNEGTITKKFVKQ